MARTVTLDFERHLTNHHLGSISKSNCERRERKKTVVKRMMKMVVNVVEDVPRPASDKRKVQSGD